MKRYISKSSADSSSGSRCVKPELNHETAVARRQVEITNRLGLHLRAADQFVRLARRFQCEIRVHYQGKECNGKSILDLTILAAVCGTRLDLEACGPDAFAAIEARRRCRRGSILRERERRLERGPAGSGAGPMRGEWSCKEALALSVSLSY